MSLAEPAVAIGGCMAMMFCTSVAARLGSADRTSKGAVLMLIRAGISGDWAGSTSVATAKSFGNIWLAVPGSLSGLMQSVGTILPFAPGIEIVILTPTRFQIELMLYLAL